MPHRSPPILLVWVVAVSVAVVGAAFPAAAAQVRPSVAMSVTRIEGADRYELAANAILRAIPGGSRAVVIANGSPSGAARGQLSASLAGACYDGNTPALFTDAEGLHPATAAAIESLGATEALIVGGESMISLAVETSLVAMGLDVHRYGGHDLYEDAYDVAIATRERAGTAFVNKAYITVDEPVVDWRAMYAIAPSAYRMAFPILFTHRASVPTRTLDALRDADIHTVTVIGSDALIDDSVLETLRARGLSVDRMVETSRIGLTGAAADYTLTKG